MPMAWLKWKSASGIYLSKMIAYWSEKNWTVQGVQILFDQFGKVFVKEYSLYPGGFNVNYDRGTQED